MKKILILILSLSMLLTGCASNPAAPSQQEGRPSVKLEEYVSFAAEGVLMPGASAALVLLTLRQKWRG